MLAFLLHTSVLCGSAHLQTRSQPLTTQISALICLAHMQIQDVVLVVSQHDLSGGEGCSILHSGGIKVSREPQQNQLVQHQQVLHQLQQHISKQRRLAANDLQQLLVKVCSSCWIPKYKSGCMFSCYNSLACYACHFNNSWVLQWQLQHMQSAFCTIHLLQTMFALHFFLHDPSAPAPQQSMQLISLLQVQTSMLYHRLHVSLDGIQLSTSNCTSSLSPQDTTVLSPCRCTAHLDLHRTPGDALLPGTKALVQLDSVHVQLKPSSLAIVNQSLQQLCTAPATDDSAAPPEAQRKVVHTQKCLCCYYCYSGATMASTRLCTT